MIAASDINHAGTQEGITEVISSQTTVINHANAQNVAQANSSSQAATTSHTSTQDVANVNRSSSSQAIVAAPYAGTERKLLVAFDVGTTYSGISYSILDPGRVPEILPVTRYPGQTRTGGNSKIPTVVYYNQEGTVCAIGAETEREGIEAIAEESNWIKAEWFKLHLRPKTATSQSVSEAIPPLPPGKTATEIFSDFLRYLDTCFKKYIEEVHVVEGTNLIASSKIDYILSHPNGWEGAQQTLMRQAAVQAGLVSASLEDQERISFITEGEASLNFCIEKGLMNNSISQGNGVIIVDAGGGTLDLSAYAQKDGGSTEFAEIAPAQCHFKGSVFVTRAAEEYLNDYLQESQFYGDIGTMREKFDKATKLSFRIKNDPQFIKFGTTRDRDPSHNIRSGQLKLDGETVASFFEPSIQCIVDAVNSQKGGALKPISTVFLVGGFAASDYLYAELTSRLNPLGLQVRRPDAHPNKAVPDGAVSGRLHHHVRTRVSRFTYGARCCVQYDESDIEHRKRSSGRFGLASGTTGIFGYFETILSKGTQVSETSEFRRPFFHESNYDMTEIESVVELEEITCYRGHIPRPTWIDTDPGNFHDICNIKVDTSPLWRRATRCNGPFGPYYSIHYEIILLFGLNELKAQLAWRENGTEQRSPAQVIFDTELVYQS